MKVRGGSFNAPPFIQTPFRLFYTRMPASVRGTVVGEKKKVPALPRRAQTLGAALRASGTAQWLSQAVRQAISRARRAAREPLDP
eukprot:scaffold5174_cov118-Isochrysis_galbana.AAC.9